jgi:hypothetical protein
METMLTAIGEDPKKYSVMTISILESLLELKEDGWKTPGQSNFCSHTDIVCTASALVVVV